MLCFPVLKILPLAILLAWDGSPGATGYHVYYGNISGIYTNVVDVDAATNLVRLPIQSGYVRVGATNIWGEGLSAELYIPPSLTVISTLQRADQLEGPWSSVASTTNNVPMTNGQGFVRVKVETR